MRARGPDIAYMCTKFGVDSLSCFAFTAWTDADRQSHREATDHQTYASATAGIGKV